MRTIEIFVALTGLAGLLFAQSPSAGASTTIAGKSITIKYSAPSVRGRQIFGDGGVYRKIRPVLYGAGANAGTTLLTAADLDIDGLNVPAGFYSLYAAHRQ